ncbi:lipopolysaccharide biosynthesis protein [Micromonospora gifhornensis]|uniref:lipopolysaccharide biosynthesis protein n=1 Tax=Micromonospora gifhornensis TaxID=84594 RepID=UPI003D728137
MSLPVHPPAPQPPATGGPAEPASDSTATETRRGARSGAAGLLGAAVNGLMGFVLVVVITRGYGTEGSGVFFAAIGVVTVAAALCVLGAETGLIWSLPRRRLGPQGDAARMLPVALIPPLTTALVIATVGILAADPLARRLLDGAGVDGAALLRVSFAAVPVVVAMTLLFGVLRCVRPMRMYVAVQSVLLPTARPLLVGAAVLLAGGGLLAGMTGWVVPALLAAAVTLLLVVGPLGIGRGAGLRAGRDEWGSFWRFSLPRAASAAIDSGAVWIGVLLTTVLAGAADAGIFGAVSRYILAGQLAMQGLRVAVSPQLSRLFGQDRPDAAAALHRQLTTWALVLSWPVYLLLAVFGAGFLELFGSGFAGGATAMTVLALAMLVNTGVGNVQSMLLMSGRSGLHLAATVAGLTVTVSLGLVLIPAHGATGAACAWAAGIVTENLIAVTCARIVVGQPLADTSMLRAALLTVGGVGAAAIVGVLAGGRGIVGLAVALAVLAVGCVGLLTLPRVRQGIRATMVQIRGGAPSVAPRPSKGR